MVIFLLSLSFFFSQMKSLSFVVLIAILVKQCVGLGILGLYCYQCVSTHPGCSTPFNWLWYWGEQCPEYDDKCVKIIERKGAEEIITRDCLSNMRSFRTDIPADHYEGCRPAAKDVRLGHYVNNSIKELDIYREHYDSTTWCFCYFDNRCNGGSYSLPSIISIALPLLATWRIFNGM